MRDNNSDLEIKQKSLSPSIPLFSPELIEGEEVDPSDDESEEEEDSSTDFIQEDDGQQRE